MTAVAEPRPAGPAGAGAATAAGAAPAAAFSPQQAISALTTDARSGWRTTEFWVAITTWVLPILALIFHRDLSSLAMPVAAVAAGGANAAYSVSRAVTKTGHAKAVAAVTVGQASVPGLGPVAGSGGAASPSTMAGSGAPGRAGSSSAAPVLDAGDASELLKSMTAALQALAVAVTKIPAAPVAEVPAARRGAKPAT